MTQHSFAKKTAVTTFWATIDKVGVLGIQFVVSLVLARLLTPSDYGVIAMFMIFIAIAQQFVECGFGNALIRKQDCTQKDLSTAFFFNIGIALIAYLIIFFLAPVIASFYDMPMLNKILRIYGLAIILNSFSIVQNAILTKRLAFKKIAKFNIISNLLTGVFAIALAYHGWGVWALVFQALFASLLTSCFLGVVTKWYPNLLFDRESMNYLWGFGSKMLLSGLISTIYSNIYSLVIGKFYDSRSLGLFNRGQQLSLLFPNILNSAFGRTTLPLLAEVQNDKERLSSIYRQFVIISVLISYPLVFLTFVLAKPFILFFLTEKWAGAIIYVQIFAVSALTSAPGIINLNLLQAVGRSDLTLKADIIKKVIGFIVIGLLIFTSPLVLAIGSSLLNIFIYIVNVYYARKVLSLSYLSQFKDQLPYFISSLLMAIVIYLVNCNIPNHLLQLIIGSCMGLIIYYLISRYVFRTEYYGKLLILMKAR
ncbi:MAG: lipopolysaccharide biosynthesis protein [Prevotellaceae bacterium]|nr:lipopolysaccharide biosynthesis protein [Prevotellaceae bacterium]MDY3365231.1 lipopolysaccharide biosynthesis protein [Prevotella sp.]